MGKFEQFLKHYSMILIWIFILVLVANTAVVLMFPRSFAKETLLEPYNPALNIYTLPRHDLTLGYEQISNDDFEALEKKRINLNIIGVVCILGWCAFNPDFHKGIKRIILEIKEKKEDENKKGKQD